MKACALALLSALVLLAGCGSGHSAASAERAVHTYWTDIGHAKMQQAYDMMTTGNRAARPFSSYSQDMWNFLESTAGISVTVGKAEVHGDEATVPVALHSPKSPGAFHAYQHLYWQNGGWKVTDENGGLSKTR